MLEKSFSESELVFGLVGAVGTELQKVRDILEERLKVIGYTVCHVRITRDVIAHIASPATGAKDDEYARLMGLMDAGNKAREKSGDNSILAIGAAAFVNSKRKRNDKGEPQRQPRHAHVISSLKHPKEVEQLRAIYPRGFHLIGVHSDEQRREDWLREDKRINDSSKVAELIARDEDEHLVHGQRVTDTFHLSDFFVRIDGDDDRLKQSLWRILALLFGHPYVTPSFDEYAMFMAFAASLHSADLSRQVGAVVAVGGQVVATGTNDTPKGGGGQYWSTDDKLPEDVEFPEDGRDFARGYDSNKIEQRKIIDDILDRAEKAGLDRKKLEETLDASRIRDLTEFGRIVHAEMEALLSCARAGISVKNGALYATTFPCHNCAKHIVAAGISRVVFIEPYSKSKAAQFHEDSIQVGFGDSGMASQNGALVQFEPFVGVGPRRFFDLFSNRLGSGYALKRKDAAGRKLKWRPEQGRLRLQMLPASYLDLELVASDMYNEAREVKEKSDAE